MGERDTAPPGGSRWRVHLAWLLVLVVAVGGTWWAVTTVLEPPAAQGEAPAPATYTLVEGEVGVRTAVMGEVVFEAGPAAFAGTGGRVTSVSVDPDVPIASGDVLFTVDLRPVIAAQGEVPAFRSLYRGLRGPDVAQLRAFLGLEEGDLFDVATRTAVREWQRELGVTVDGVVALGDVLFLPALPTRGYASAEVSVGAPVSAGQEVVATVLDRPQIYAFSDSARPLSAGLAVSATLGDEVLTGVLGNPIDRLDGRTVLPVHGPDGLSVCDPSCAAGLGISAPTQVTLSVEVVPATAGIVVPDAALHLLPDGTVALRVHGADLVPIEVLAQAEGMTVVSGIEAGTVIDLFATDPA